MTQKPTDTSKEGAEIINLAARRPEGTPRTGGGGQESTPVEAVIHHLGGAGINSPRSRALAAGLENLGAINDAMRRAGMPQADADANDRTQKANRAEFEVRQSLYRAFESAESAFRTLESCMKQEPFASQLHRMPELGRDATRKSGSSERHTAWEWIQDHCVGLKGDSSGHLRLGHWRDAHRGWFDRAAITVPGMIDEESGQPAVNIKDSYTLHYSPSVMHTCVSMRPHPENAPAAFTIYDALRKWVERVPTTNAASAQGDLFQARPEDTKEAALKAIAQLRTADIEIEKKAGMLQAIEISKSHSTGC